MRQPITFIYRNLVFGDGSDDVWGVYRLPTRAYAGLPVAGKREMLLQLAALAYGLEADFSLLRVARPWDVDHYLLGVLTTSDVRHVRRKTLDAYLERQREALGSRESHTFEVYLSVRLDAARTVSPGPLGKMPGMRALRRAMGIGDARALSGRRLDVVLGEEEATRHRILDYVDAKPAATHELQWLIRRAFTRGLGDPFVDERFWPQALVVDAPEGDGRCGYRPLEADVLRLFDSPINVRARGLHIETETGESHQALLCLGALPEIAPFPGRQAELLFAPLEALEFPVDAAFSARFVSNRDAVRMVRRGIVGVDNMNDEITRYRGPLAGTVDRPREVRELEDYLTGGDHPPLLRATVSLALGAPTQPELEARVQYLRREYGTVKLHRPLGEQLGLFISHLPGRPVQLTDYDDYLTVEQFGAMVPTATHSVGAETGTCIGYTLAGPQRPVLFDVTESTRSRRSPATLLAGKPGSGKSLCMELIMYQAFLAGSMICDIDPQGDHMLDRLPGVAEEMEVIELSADERCRGLLDPLRIAPEEIREDLACSFLTSILPEPLVPAWQTEIRRAVQTVVDADGRCCGEVVEELRHGSAEARVAARALGVYAASGLAMLGFAEPGASMSDGGSRHVVSLRIQSLELPGPGTPSGERTEEERLSHAVLHLLGVYALHLTGFDRRRHAVLGLDDAGALLSDEAGRALIERISRLGRTQNVTPLLGTRSLSDVDELENLIGAAFCFGVEAERDACAALRLLNLDEQDTTLQHQLTSFRHGCCLMRDYGGRVSPIEIDLLDPEMVATLDTTPAPAPSSEPPETQRRAAESGVTDPGGAGTVHEFARSRPSSLRWGDREASSEAPAPARLRVFPRVDR